MLRICWGEVDSPEKEAGKNTRLHADVTGQLGLLSGPPLSLNHSQMARWAKALRLLFKNHLEDFPGGAVVKNPPANAGDMGSSPGPGGSHMPRSNWARAPQLLEPVLHNRRGYRNERPAHGQRGVAPARRN